MGKYFSNLGGEEASLNISCKQETRPIEGLAAKVKIYTVREVTNIVMALERYFVNFSLTCKRKYSYYPESNEENQNAPKKNMEGHRLRRMGGQYRCGQRSKLTKTTGVESK